LYISLPSRRTKCIRIVVSQLHNAIQHPVQTDFRFKRSIDWFFPMRKIVSRRKSRRKQSLLPQISVTVQKKICKDEDRSLHAIIYIHLFLCNIKTRRNKKNLYNHYIYGINLYSQLYITHFIFWKINYQPLENRYIFRQLF
jgi:hypothetical protein